MKIILPAMAGEHIEDWDLLSDKKYAVDITVELSAVKFSAELKPAESRLYIIRKDAQGEMFPKRVNQKQLSFYKSLGPVFNIKRDLPNSLTLDKCAWRFADVGRGLAPAVLSGGHSDWSEEMQVWQAQREVRAKLGMYQVHKNGIKQRYLWALDEHENDGARVEFKFEFYADCLPAENILLAIEQSALFDVYINDVPAERIDGYFIDKCIGLVKLSGAQPGLNELVIACNYKNRFEVEDCYIIGDFGVTADRRITETPTKLRLGDWCLQGLPHYAGAVTYETTMEIVGDGATPNGKRYFAQIGKFNATTISLRVNGKHAGHIPWASAGLVEITEFVQGGANTFEIEVSGSPRNLFGPFHMQTGDPGTTNPASFRADGEGYNPEYNLKPYGLDGLVKIMVL